MDTTTIAGAALWSLALYLGFSSTSEWVIEQLNRWLNFAERSLAASDAEFNRSRRRKESQNALYASLFSTVPFLAVGLICNYGMEVSLGRSWAISFGIIACIGCGVYELGRRSGQTSS
ncbi:MAG: hypothetical protein QNJ46_30940 [Leptolyngbyaceae cyanobacterium MO_188.B28]|nr:hypothetical protein [Leptolyngbyaceae cyanobacterium MO_188.B28]